jgi:beta-xylosidase
MWLPQLFSSAIGFALTTNVLASPFQVQQVGAVMAIDSDFPDPSFVQATDGTWYAFGTNGNGKRVQVASSSDFKTWALLDKEALPTLAKWETEIDHWAPDVIKRVSDSHRPCSSRIQR